MGRYLTPEGWQKSHSTPVEVQFEKVNDELFKVGDDFDMGNVYMFNSEVWDKELAIEYTKLKIDIENLPKNPWAKQEDIDNLEQRIKDYTGEDRHKREMLWDYMIMTGKMSIGLDENNNPYPIYI